METEIACSLSKLQSLRQEDCCEFKASLDYAAKSYFFNEINKLFWLKLVTQAYDPNT